MAARRKTHRFEPQTYQFTYGGAEAVLTVRPGETVVAKTADAFGFDEHGRSIPASKMASRDDTEFYAVNPLVGPIAVEGAEPGDTLVVEIRKIALNRPYATSGVEAAFGCFTGECDGKRMSFTPNMKEKEFRWRLDLKRNSGTLRLEKSRMKSMTIPLQPFLGSIGVAPRWGRVETSLTPGEYGGNMDCVETRRGATLYFPVFVSGGLLAFGDVHAAQGDGEICGIGLEATAEVTLRLNVIKNHALDWPRMEDRDWIMTAGSARPLWDAYRLAHREMLRWLVGQYGFGPDEGLQVLSQVGRARVGNVCDPNYTVIAKFPKKHLPKPGVRVQRPHSGGGS